MIIQNHQIATFRAQFYEIFILKAIVHLRTNYPLWAETKDSFDIRRHIIMMIEIGKNYEIYSESNIQKLLDYHFEFQLDIPLLQNIANELSDFSIVENIRVENFYLFLLSSRNKLIKIKLDTSIITK